MHMSKHDWLYEIFMPSFSTCKLVHRVSDGWGIMKIIQCSFSAISTCVGRLTCVCCISHGKDDMALAKVVLQTPRTF